MARSLSNLVGTEREFAFYSKFVSKPLENFKLRSDIVWPDVFTDDSGC